MRCTIILGLVGIVAFAGSIALAAEGEIEFHPVELPVPSYAKPENNPLRGMYTTDVDGKTRLDPAQIERYLTFVETNNAAWRDQMRQIFGAGDGKGTASKEVNERLVLIDRYEKSLKDLVRGAGGDNAKLAQLDELLSQRESILGELLSKANEKAPGDIVMVDGVHWAVKSALPPEVADFLTRSVPRPAEAPAPPGDHGDPGGHTAPRTGDKAGYEQVVTTVLDRIRSAVKGGEGEHIGGSKFLDRLQTELLAVKDPQKQGEALALLAEVSTLSHTRTCSQCKAPMEALIEAMVAAHADSMSRAQVYQIRNDLYALEGLGRIMVFRTKLSEALLGTEKFAKKATGATPDAKLESLKQDPALYQAFLDRVDDRMAEFLTMDGEGRDKLHDAAVDSPLFREFATADEGKAGKELEEDRGWFKELLRGLCEGDCIPWLVTGGACKRAAK